MLTGSCLRIILTTNIFSEKRDNMQIIYTLTNPTYDSSNSNSGNDTKGSNLRMYDREV